LSEDVKASDVAAIQDFLAEKINIGRAAELLHLSRFELIPCFNRLDISCRIDPATLEEARAEVATALRHSQSNGVHNV
jgi:hypothetical protein